MDKQMLIRLISLLILVIVTSATIPVVDKSPKAVAEWFKKLPHAKQTVTTLHFFFHNTRLHFDENHEIITRADERAPVVGKSDVTLQSPTYFGLVRVYDNPLTAGPEPTSTLVGRAQGSQASASMTEAGLLMNMNLVFTDGQFNGSTLSILGRIAEAKDYSEMPIIGGSGVFRLAQGVAATKPYYLDAERATVEYTVTVLHYSYENQYKEGGSCSPCISSI